MRNLILIIGVAFAAITTHAQSLLIEQPETPAQAAAREVLAAPAQTRDVILNQLNDAFSRLWDAPDPQAVLDAMGPKAGRVFAINTRFAQVVQDLLIEEGDTVGLARFQQILAKIPPCTVHEDGTVTINPPAPSE